MGRPGWVLPPAEIVTGERLQALAEAILIPRLVTRRHRSAPATSRNAVVFDEHRGIGAEHLERFSRARSLSIYANALALFKEHVWPKLPARAPVAPLVDSVHPLKDAAKVHEYFDSGAHIGKIVLVP